VRGSKFASIYAVAVGALMIIMWSFFIVSGQVPEFQTKPEEILLHIVAEMLTALLLLVSGVLVLRRITWGNLTLLVAFGMLFYTMIVSPGYYIQNGTGAFVVMFALLLALGIVAAVVQIRRLLSSR
jgi:peptidoglycan/LPS O-acetylase OafA/YrhL